MLFRYKALSLYSRPVVRGKKESPYLTYTVKSKPLVNINITSIRIFQCVSASPPQPMPTPMYGMATNDVPRLESSPMSKLTSVTTLGRHVGD
jgi:hypothetical protein